MAKKGMAMELYREERKVAERELRILLPGFVANPFSTTSRALAHKGAETKLEEEEKEA